ncbi:MAG: FmdB family zinc ribbon protein [Acidobacteriota bacterium]
MPLYEYQCEKCGKIVEVIQKFADAPLIECAHCGGELVRLLSAPAIQFKGSGWYITDYSRKNGSASTGDSPKQKDDSGKSGAESKEASETKSTASTDSKASSAS